MIKSIDLLEVQDWLEVHYQKYACPLFIETDPISIPHLFKSDSDREIAGFFTSIISWGARPIIIRNAKLLMNLMGFEPTFFIKNVTITELSSIKRFVHRTFQPDDFFHFVLRLQYLLNEYGSLESVFESCWIESNYSMAIALDLFWEKFMPEGTPKRTQKHLPRPGRGAAAKRMLMYFRWMVRPSFEGIDFGQWKCIKPKDLYLPLDLHSGKNARSLGILHRRGNDWKAVEEVTAILRKMDLEDPIRFDFALYGAGAYEKHTGF